MIYDSPGGSSSYEGCTAFFEGLWQCNGSGEAIDVMMGHRIGQKTSFPVEQCEVNK